MLGMLFIGFALGGICALMLIEIWFSLRRRIF